MSTLLIVDDEKNLLKLYQREFLEDGYDVLIASSGAEALEKLRLQVGRFGHFGYSDAGS